MFELYEDRVQLQKIRDRYFRETEEKPDFRENQAGYLRHLPQCRLNHSHNPGREVFFCSCGLLHDLSCLSHELADMIWPDTRKEVWCQERQQTFDGPFPAPEVKAEWEASERLLVEVFGPFTTTDEEIIELNVEYKKIIQQVFGQAFLESLPTERVLSNSLAYIQRCRAWMRLFEQKNGRVVLSSPSKPDSSGDLH
jgi:hypothetical protein